jgi:hypothetical protein
MGFQIAEALLHGKLAPCAQSQSGTADAGPISWTHFLNPFLETDRFFPPAHNHAQGTAPLAFERKH